MRFELDGILIGNAEFECKLSFCVQYPRVRVRVFASLSILTCSLSLLFANTRVTPNLHCYGSVITAMRPLRESLLESKNLYRH